MRKIALVFAVLVGCSDRPTQPPAEISETKPSRIANRPWTVWEIKRSEDPPSLSSKAYVYLIYPNPQNDAAIRDCLATAVKEFVPNDERGYDRQLYFTIRRSAAEWRSPTGGYLADATFDLKRDSALRSIDQAESIVINWPETN